MHTVWHEKFTVIIFYSLPLNHLDEIYINLDRILILGKPSLVLNVVIIYNRFPSSLWIVILVSAVNRKIFMPHSMSHA